MYPAGFLLKMPRVPLAEVVDKHRYQDAPMRNLPIGDHPAIGETSWFLRRTLDTDELNAENADEALT